MVTGPPTMAELLRRLLEEMGLDAVVPSAPVEFTGRGPALPSPLRVIDAGALTLGAQAESIAAVDRAMGRERQDASIDLSDVVFALRPFPYLRVDGQASDAWKRQITEAPCSGHMRTADGRHIYMANVVPRLRDRTLRLLGCAPTREAVEAAVETWNGIDLEVAMAEEGLPLTLVRSEDEWHALAQAQVLASRPLAPVEDIGEAAPLPLPRGVQTLEGLRVLDLTHVVAGPMITRGLAEYGADVLHVGPVQDELQDPVAVTNELMIGKRSIRLDLKSASELSELERLVSQADVLVQSWRPGVMDRLGMSRERVARLRPGIVQLDVSCYGPDGPWGDRPGFDGNALAAVGATWREAHHGPPKLSPPGVLTDSLVGFLGVAVINSMLLARADRGGSRSAHLSLARVAMWLMELGTIEPGPDASPDRWGSPRLRAALADDGSQLQHVGFPIAYGRRPARLNGHRPSLGASAPAWS